MFTVKRDNFKTLFMFPILLMCYSGPYGSLVLPKNVDCLWSQQYLFAVIVEYLWELFFLKSNLDRLIPARIRY